MAEADALASRVAILSKRLLAVGTTAALRRKYRNLHYVGLLLKTAPNTSVGEMEGVLQWIQREIPGARLERDMLGGQIRFTVPGVGSAATTDTETELEVAPGSGPNKRGVVSVREIDGANGSI